jgi:hypothetical protein
LIVQRILVQYLHGLSLRDQIYTRDDPTEGSAAFRSHQVSMLPDRFLLDRIDLQQHRQSEIRWRRRELLFLRLTIARATLPPAIGRRKHGDLIREARRLGPRLLEVLADQRSSDILT